MAVTKFKGPINSVEGFQLDGTATTWAATAIISSAASSGSNVCLASQAGLSTVLWGIAAQRTLVHGGTPVYVQVETSKNGVVGSSASFQLTYFTSADATMSSADSVMGAGTFDVLLIGAG